MSTPFSDVRFAVRGLRRSPLFASVAILSLALGIGANTAIFTLIDQILLRALPVARPEQLVMLHQEGSNMGSNMGTRMHSYPLYQDLQQKAEPLAEVLCRRLVPASVSVDNQTERVQAELVSGNYFTMLGVTAAAGRLFYSQEDDRIYEMTLPAAKDWSAYSRDRFMKGRLVVTSAAIGFSPVRNDFSTALIVLMCMVGLVLLIACANVANLLTARAFMRQKEVAVRLSIGASRGRLVRQLLVESLVLSCAGGVLGVAMAIMLTRALLALAPAQGQPLLLSAHPDVRVLTFTASLTMVTAIVFGLLPALRASRTEPWSTLKDTIGSIAGTRGSLVLRKGLVTAQVALSFLLLFGAGLFVRSLQNLKTADTGVALDNLLTFQLSPSLSGYDEARATLFYRQLLDRLRSAPGVKSAGMATVPILAGDEWDSSMSVEGHQAKDGEDMQAFMNAVSPGYFETMKIPMLDGRDFRAGDAQRQSTVAIVNRRFAEHYFSGKSAVGKHIGFGGGPRTKLTIEIIGVVANSLYEGPREGVRRQVFLPNWGKNSAVFYVRTQTAASTAYGVVRDEVRQLDAAIPVYEVKTLEGQLDETLLTDRLIAVLSAGFGLVATLLASVGLYGVMAFVVAQRRKELGIRLALGAPPGRLVWMVMREVLLLLVIGLAVGVPAGLALGRYVASQLYGIQAHDPIIATSTVLLLTIISAAAGLIPAQRASRIDPMLALRTE